LRSIAPANNPGSKTDKPKSFPVKAEETKVPVFGINNNYKMK